MTLLRACKKCLMVCHDDSMHDGLCTRCAGVRPVLRAEHPVLWWWQEMGISYAVGVVFACLILWLLHVAGVLVW